MERPSVLYKSFLSSDPFQVKGPKGKSFLIHSALLAKQSRALDRAVNGPMAEAQERQITFSGVNGEFDDATVMRFIEYAYTGSYTLPGSKRGGQSILTEKDAASAANNAFDFGSDSELEFADADMLSIFAQVSGAAIPSTEPPPEGTPMAGPYALVQVTSAPHSPVQDLSTPSINLLGAATTTTARPLSPILVLSASSTAQRKRISESELKERFSNKRRKTQARSIVSPLPTPLPDLPPATEEQRQSLWDTFTSEAYVIKPDPWEPNTNKLGQHFATNLICHAQLYVFANRYECFDLTQLVLQRLKLTLARVPLRFCTSSIVDLIAYIYIHTQEYQSGCDALRSLIIDYVVCQLPQLVKNMKFRDLLGQEGPIVRDLRNKTTAKLDSLDDNDGDEQDSPSFIEYQQGFIEMTEE